VSINEQKANAYLIANAVNLLDALKALVKATTRTPLEDLPEVHQAVSIINQAEGNV
jgi:hypothetical protein